MKELLQLSKSIKTYRLQYHFTQRFVADKLGITPQSYCGYELGITVPTLKHLVELADLYDVSIDEMLGRKVY